MIITKDDIGKYIGIWSSHKVVFTNGCFDILHAGHVDFLDKASDLGDILIVGINSDASVKKLKGPGRPINCAGYRASVLDALKSVDYVIVFEDSPKELIQTILPDILVKGDQYLESQIEGEAIVRSAGGKVMTIPIMNGISTTLILDRIRIQ